MRHTREELAELLLPLAPQVVDAVGAGIAAAARSRVPMLRAPHKRALYSHVVRSGIYDYLEKNPLEGFPLKKRAHRLNQSVALSHESGLEARFAKLRNLSVAPSIGPIPRIDEDPAIAEALFQLEHQFQEPGLVIFSWDRPRLDPDGYPAEEIKVFAVRTAPGTKLKDGSADVIIPLSAQVQTIPDEAFDPNEDDVNNYQFSEEEDADDA